MALREFDQHDHPDSIGVLPQVGCNVCGHAVQPALELKDGQHWDDLEPEARQAALEEMARWSHEHAPTHPQQEHDRAHQDFREGAAWPR